MPAQSRLPKTPAQAAGLHLPARPLLPDAEALAPYLARIDHARWYTNMGPLASELETRLLTALGVDYGAHFASLASSGTSSLWAALVALGRRSGGFCLMPSWTFGATAAAALHAGLTPYFLDVEGETWALDPEATARRAHDLKPTAIVPVMPFGAAVDLDAWAEVSRETGAAVVIDAAAAFDTLAQTPVKNAPPLIFSLHATKVLPSGEGGALVTTDESLDKQVRRLLNFGFHGDRLAREPGFNGKLSEYHAAIGLASLDQWSIIRAEWLAAKALLNDALMRADGASAFGPDAAGGHACSTFHVLTDEGETAEALAARLKARGTASIRWWGPGCRAQPAYAHCPADPLPVTQHLADRALGLPLFRDLTAEHARAIAGAF